MKSKLESKIIERRARVGVVGLGYAGLPLALEFVRAGFKVVGIDIDAERVRLLRRGTTHVKDVDAQALKTAVQDKRLEVTTDYGVVAALDCISVCVPTPLGKSRDPDISYIVDATRRIKQYIHEDMLIVLESTTYPGTTEEVVIPELLDSRYQVGKNLFVAFSPERVDPTNPQFNTRNTPKVIGGVTPQCTHLARLLYAQAVDHVVTVSSPACAEMTKLLENIFRAVNIGLVNEIALMCDKLNISVWEVIDAAATKPFGFMPFYPGPGLGGHCIPIDPLYLSWKLKTLNYTARFIELADDVNSHMPEYVVGKVSRGLNQSKKCLNGARILVLGVTYKRNVNDVRESPALDIIRLLQRDGARVDYSDPHVPSLRHEGLQLESIKLGPKTASRYDCVVLVTDHSDFDYPAIQENARLIFDSRNAFRKPGANVMKL
ncbi:MAG: nucleotide sugar dehydrogenase [Acidobacteriota bacterium]